MKELLALFFIFSSVYACSDHESAAYSILSLLNPTLIKQSRAPHSGDYHPTGTQWHAVYAPLDGPEPASIEFYIQKSKDPRTPQWVYVGCNGLYDRVKKPYTPVSQEEADSLEEMLSYYPDAKEDCLRTLAITSLKDFPQSRYILVKNWYEKYHKQPLNLTSLQKE